MTEALLSQKKKPRVPTLMPGDMHEMCARVCRPLYARVPSLCSWAIGSVLRCQDEESCANT
jgi:hypothetical protein